MRSFASDEARDACATIGDVLTTDPARGQVLKDEGKGGARWVQRVIR